MANRCVFVNMHALMHAWTRVCVRMQDAHTHIRIHTFTNTVLAAKVKSPSLDRNSGTLASMCVDRWDEHQKVALNYRPQVRIRKAVETEFKIASNTMPRQEICYQKAARHALLSYPRNSSASIANTSTLNVSPLGCQSMTLKIDLLRERCQPCLTELTSQL